LSVNFQFLQKTHFSSPRSGADHLFTNIESYCAVCSYKTLNYDCAKLRHLQKCAMKCCKRLTRWT